MEYLALIPTLGPLSFKSTFLLMGVTLLVDWRFSRSNPAPHASEDFSITETIAWSFCLLIILVAGISYDRQDFIYFQF